MGAVLCIEGCVSSIPGFYPLAVRRTLIQRPKMAVEEVEVTLISSLELQLKYRIIYLNN